MVVIAHHLRCDSRKVCSQCSIYLWKPRKPSDPKFYYYCPACKHDILCDRGLIQDFVYDDMEQAERVIYRCLICRTEVEERRWPPEDGIILDLIE